MFEHLVRGPCFGNSFIGDDLLPDVHIASGVCDRQLDLLSKTWLTAFDKSCCHQLFGIHTSTRLLILQNQLLVVQD